MIYTETGSRQTHLAKRVIAKIGQQKDIADGVQLIITSDGVQ